MDMELLGWLIMLVIGVAVVVGIVYPWRDPKEDDPYRYCPKDDE